MRKAASIFSLACGVMMLLVWGVLLSTGNAPELRTKPLEAVFLLAAEFLTAASLIVGGWGSLSRKSWSFTMQLVALGMLLYCAVFSVGVVGQQDNLLATGFFVVVAPLTAIFSANFIVKSKKEGGVP